MQSARKTSYATVDRHRVAVAGWLEHQARTALTGYVGAMPRLSSEVGGEVFAAGRLGPDSDFTGSNVADIEWWNGESEGNWLLAWVTHATLLHDPSTLAEVERYLGRVLAAQDDDGYIGMFTPRARAGRPYITGDLWTQSRVLRALQIWATYTDDEEVWHRVGRALAHAHARYVEAVEAGEAFAQHTGDSCGRGHDLMIVEVLVEQISHSFDAALLDFAIAVYDGYSSAELEWPDADGQLSRLLSDEPVVGHGAHTAEHLRIPLLLAAFTGRADFMAAFESGYRKVCDALGIGGALKSDETIGAPGSEPVPLPEAGYEFCAMTELTQTLLEAARHTGDMAYVDRAEHLFLNSAQAATAKDGRSVAYLVAENQIEASHTLGTRWDYSPTHDDVAVCCAPNAGRILPIVAEHMVVRTQEGVAVQLFGPMSATLDVDGDRVTITQETSFPFDQAVRIHVDAQTDAEFAVDVRIPGWCADPTVTVLGADGAEQTREHDRVRITARWSAASVVVVDLPHSVRALSTVDGRIALSAGPLVYSMPIESSASPHRTYDTADYADLDVVRTSASSLYPPALLGSQLGEVRMELATDDSPSPWESPKAVLVARALDPNPKDDAFEGAGVTDIRLVPFGATSLRWTAFPVIGTGRRIGTERSYPGEVPGRGSVARAGG